MARVEEIVITDKAGLTVAGHVEIIAGEHPDDVVVEPHVLRAAIHQHRVADRLIQVVVVDLRSAGGKHDRLVRVGIVQVVGNHANEPACPDDTDRVAVDLVSEDLDVVIDSDAVDAVVVDPVLLEG